MQLAGAGFQSLTEAIDTTTPAGRIGGRCSKLTQRQQQEILKLIDSGRKNAAEAARLFNVHPSTIARLLSKNKLQHQH